MENFLPTKWAWPKSGRTAPNHQEAPRTNRSARCGATAVRWRGGNWSTVQCDDEWVSKTGTDRDWYSKPSKAVRTTAKQDEESMERNSKARRSGGTTRGVGGARETAHCHETIGENPLCDARSMSTAGILLRQAHNRSWPCWEQLFDRRMSAMRRLPPSRCSGPGGVIPSASSSQLRYYFRQRAYPCLEAVLS